MAEKVVHTVWTVNNVLSQSIPFSQKGLDQLKKRVWTQEVIDDSTISLKLCLRK